MNTNNTNEQQYPIRRTWILSILLIIPVLSAVWLWDMFLNDRGLLPYLGLTSLLLPLYLLFFEMPHIIASFVGFIDKEYLGHYRTHLLFGVPLLLAAFIGLLLVDFMTAVAVYLAVTMYHVVRQQTGIGLMFDVPKDRWFSWWSWSLTVSIAVMYVGIVLPKYVEGLEASHLTFFIAGTFALAIVSGIGLMLGTKTKWGIWYILLTLVMVAASYSMLWFGYFFLAVFVGRFVHDVTAFLFYITHEMNRNNGRVRNVLYTIVPFLPLSLIIFVPLIAIVLGLLLREGIANQKILFTIVMLLAFTHYYPESVMWKRNSLHRQYVKVVMK